MTKQKYTVTGMTCSACSSHVEKSVCKLSGMGDVTVNLLTNSMQVQYDENLCSEDSIIEAVEKAGYGASPVQAGGARQDMSGSGERGVREDAGNRSLQKESGKDKAGREALNVAEPSRTGMADGTVSRKRKRADLCVYPVFAHASDYLCEQEVLPDRI